MVRTINAARLLSAWESAAAVPMSRRAAVLLSVTHPERSSTDWATCPLGERDHALLRLRETLFGGTIETVARCSVCGESMEAQFQTSDLTDRFAPPGTLEREVNGKTLRFRVPTEADVVAAIASSDPHRCLIERCVELAGTLEDRDIKAVIQAMEAEDPQADIHIEVNCPSCVAANKLAFDIVSYFWSDLTDWARRILADVHTLAAAYGWSEADILAMTAFRRRMYLQMLGSEA